eukprot:483581-Rhodomonas_salina.1
MVRWSPSTCENSAFACRIRVSQYHTRPTRAPHAPRIPYLPYLSSTRASHAPRIHEGWPEE